MIEAIAGCIQLNSSSCGDDEHDECVSKIVSFAYNVNIFERGIAARGRRDRDHMVVEFTTTYEISVYPYLCCMFESWSGRGVQHYVIKLVRSVVFSGFLHQWNWPPRYSWNIVVGGVKHHQTNKYNASLLSSTAIFTRSRRGLCNIYTTCFRLKQLKNRTPSIV